MNTDIDLVNERMVYSSEINMFYVKYTHNRFLYH